MPITKQFLYMYLERFWIDVLISVKPPTAFNALWAVLFICYFCTKIYFIFMQYFLQKGIDKP